MLALIETAFHAAQQLHDKLALHFAAAERSGNAGTLLAIVRPSRTNTLQFGIQTALLTTALMIFPAIHTFLPHRVPDHVERLISFYSEICKKYAGVLRKCVLLLYQFDLRMIFISIDKRDAFAHNHGEYFLPASHRILSNSYSITAMPNRCQKNCSQPQDFLVYTELFSSPLLSITIQQKNDLAHRSHCWRRPVPSAIRRSRTAARPSCGRSLPCARNCAGA
jgi:hypothetical protein